MHSNIITQKVKKVYDSIAAEFSQTRNFPWKEFEVFNDFYREDFSVLDLGCGNGRLLLYLKKQGYKDYVGVDQSKELLKFAKKQFPLNTFRLGDISKQIKFQKKFDAVFFAASFHHIPPDLQLRTLKNAVSHLKKGGYIFMSNWNLHQRRFFLIFLRSILTPGYENGAFMIPWRNKLKRHYYRFTKKRLESLFRAAGLKVILNDYYSGSEKSGMFKGKNIITIGVK